MQDVFAAFLFFLPAGIANTAPTIANKIPGLKNWRTPLDFGQKWHGRRLLGPNKTWRGLVSGAVLGGFTAMAEYVIFSKTHVTSGHVLSFLLGVILGLGALTGDAVESFFKRQANVPAGHSWFPFDQLDYISVGLVFIYPFVHPSLNIMAWVIVLYFGLHLIVSYIGYVFGFKERPI